jgi:hypothetical protein
MPRDIKRATCSTNGAVRERETDTTCERERLTRVRERDAERERERVSLDALLPTSKEHTRKNAVKLKHTSASRQWH